MHLQCGTAKIGGEEGGDHIVGDESSLVGVGEKSGFLVGVAVVLGFGARQAWKDGLELGERHVQIFAGCE
jgi:hypothetical protein